MTGQDIILKARRIADIVNSKFISDEEALDYLNEAYRVYYDKIIGTAVDWAMKSYAVKREEVQEFSDGNRIYWVIEPPKDMYKLRGLSVCVGGYRRDLRMFPKLEEFTYPECSYRLTSDHKIKVINPASADRGTFIIEYYAPAKEIVFEQPPLRGTKIDCGQTINYCFDCGEFFVYGLFHDAEEVTMEGKYKYIVLRKSDFSVYREFRFDDSDCRIIGVTKDYIYYIKDIKQNYGQIENLVIVKTSVDDPFAREQTVYTFASEEELPLVIIWPIFSVSYDDGSLFLTKIKQDYKTETEIEHTIELIRVLDGVEEVTHSLTQHISENDYDDQFYFIAQTGTMYLSLKVYDREGTYPQQVFRCCATWEDVLNDNGVIINDDEYMNYLILNDSTFYCLEQNVVVSENCANYTIINLEKTSTPTNISTERTKGWEIYTKPSDVVAGGSATNNIVYISETEREEQQRFLPFGANVDYLVYYLAVCFLEKQGKDASRFQQKLAEIEYRLIEELTADEHRHQSVANNFRKNNSGWGWL